MRYAVMKFKLLLVVFYFMRLSLGKMDLFLMNSFDLLFNEFVNLAIHLNWLKRKTLSEMLIDLLEPS